jgi:hypothetical protein
MFPVISASEMIIAKSSVQQYVHVGFYLIESIFGCAQSHVVLTGRYYQLVEVSVGSTQTFIQCRSSVDTEQLK